MSLDELRAEAETEEAEKPEEPKQPEVEEESEPKSRKERLDDLEKERDANLAEDEEGEEEAEAEPSEDFELELDGEPEPGQQKPSAEDALVHKLTKQRKRAKEAESQVEKLERQVQELTTMLKGGQVQQPQPVAQNNAKEPQFPDMYDPGIDGDRQKYDAAVKKYFADIQSYQQRNSEAANQQEQYQKAMEEKTSNLAKRAAKFMQENKISESRVITALEKATSEVDQATGIDGALAYLLDSVGDGGERAAYYIGTNDAAMAKVKQLLKEDPSGLKALPQLTRWSEQLKPKHSKQTSKAPPPDEPLKGDGSTVSSKRLQDMYDKESDPNKLMELRKKARERGVKLS